MAGVSDCALQKDRPNPIFCSSKRKRKRARRWLPQLITRVSSVVHSQFSALLALPPPLSKVTAARRQATCARWALIRRTSRTRAAANKFQRPEGRLILPRIKNGSGSRDHRAVVFSGTRQLQPSRPATSLARVKRAGGPTPTRRKFNQPASFAWLACFIVHCKKTGQTPSFAHQRENESEQEDGYHNLSQGFRRSCIRSSRRC